MRNCARNPGGNRLGGAEPLLYGGDGGRSFLRAVSKAEIRSQSGGQCELPNSQMLTTVVATHPSTTCVRKWTERAYLNQLWQPHAATAFLFRHRR